ncbi:MAG: ATP-binding cassette domain-containing protein [Treponema sp.]|nr:ATP-binding cassette domain-containing protein [Treponema sp.]
MNKLCIRVQDLSYSYGKALPPALRNLNVDFYTGVYTAILGANGSGKSTLLNCINGLCVPPPGSVSVYDDDEVLDPARDDDLERIRRRVGTVMQNPEDQIVAAVVEEDVAFGPGNLGLPENEISRRLEGALKIAGLEELRDRDPQFLSGGEKQRLAVAGVLAMESEVIALDEAVSMIDPRGRETLLGLLDALSASGKTILHITHSLRDAFRASRCLALYRGTLVFDGPPGDLAASPSLEEWGFRLPESIKVLRLFSKLYPGFSASSLEPAGIVQSLIRFRSSGKGRGPVLRGPAAEHSPGGGETERPRSFDGGTNSVIQFDAVSHEYLRGTPLAAAGLSECSCRIPRNASVVLVGASGSGKSTALKHINALLLPTKGRVLVFGKDTLDRKTNLRDLRFKAALAVQNPESALFETYVADDVAYGPRNAGLTGQDLALRVRRALAETGLPYGQFADRETAALSGGEKRRAALAGVLAMDSEILLLDEPAASLDGQGRELILNLIRELRRTGKTVVSSTHSMDMAATFDLVGVMVKGRLAAFGPPREIFGESWQSSWGLDLPWITAAARILAAAGMIPPGKVPLTAEELAVLLDGSGGAAPAAEPGTGTAGYGADASGGTVRDGTGTGRAENGAAVLPETGKTRPPRSRRKTGLEFFRNRGFGQYLNSPSPLQRLGAGKKMGLLFLTGTLAIAGPPPFFPLGILTLALIAGSLAGKAGPGHLLRGMIPVLPYIGLILFVQLFFPRPQDTSRVLLTLGAFSLTAGAVLRIVFLFCRLGALMALFSLYTAVTTLEASINAVKRRLAPLSRLGIPAGDIALAVGIALRFIPVLTGEAERIVTAQLSRGSGKSRIRTTVTMVVPLLLRALERSEMLAKAMMLRLYPAVPKKTRKAPAVPKRMA